MGKQKLFDDIIEEKLLDMDTAYIAKVLSYNNGEATVQPLNMVKQHGKTAIKPSVVSNVPVVSSARYKLSFSEVEVMITETEKGKIKVAVPTELTAGDLVFCVCADRDITEARRGKMSIPQIGHHNKSDSVVIGIL